MSASAPHAHAAAELDPRRTCAFCLRNERLRADQILLQGSHSYLCAPRGQLIEGFLLLVPYGCIASLSHGAPELLAELERGREIVERFYADELGCTAVTFYEQGRGGGGRTTDASGFPLHAHLCALPAAPDLHGWLQHEHESAELSELAQLPAFAAGKPYAFVSSRSRDGDTRTRLYVARDDEGRACLERARLKPVVAELLGHPDRGDWRTFPGDTELERLIRRFRAHESSRSSKFA